MNSAMGTSVKNVQIESLSAHTAPLKITVGASQTGTPMTKAQLEAENDALLNVLAEVRERLQQLEELVREALNNDGEEEE